MGLALDGASLEQRLLLIDLPVSARVCSLHQVVPISPSLPKFRQDPRVNDATYRYLRALHQAR